MTTNLRTFRKCLIAASVCLAIFYTLVFILKLWPSVAAQRSGTADIDWSLKQSPQFAIWLPLLGSALVSLFWRLRAKFLIMFVLFGAVLLRFATWAASTAQIKSNTGLSSIPDASWIGNIWIGAGKAELVTLILTLILFVAHAILLFRLLTSRATKAAKHEPSFVS